MQRDVSKNIDHSKGKTDSFEEVSHIKVCNFASDNESLNSNNVVIDNFLKSLIVPSIHDEDDQSFPIWDEKTFF